MNEKIGHLKLAVEKERYRLLENKLLCGKSIDKKKLFLHLYSQQCEF